MKDMSSAIQEISRADKLPDKSPNYAAAEDFSYSGGKRKQSEETASKVSVRLWVYFSYFPRPIAAR